MEQRVGHLAGHHIGFIAVGDGKNHVGILGTCTGQDIRVRGMTDDRTDINTILQILKDIGPMIDHGDVIGFAGQILGYR